MVSKKSTGGNSTEDSRRNFSAGEEKQHAMGKSVKDRRRFWMPSEDGALTAKRT
jgi:hypothetical protein